MLLHAVQHEGGAAHTPHTLRVEVARHNVLPVLPPPEDLRRGVAAGLACQVDSLLLPHHEVVGCLAVNDRRRHLDLEIPSPAPHGVCVDLAHVPASVLFLHVRNVELPLLVLPVRERHSLVPGDDAVVDGEYGLGVHPHPGHLVGAEVGHVAREHGLPPGHHRFVVHVVRELRRTGFCREP